MAKFVNKNLRLKDNQLVTWGDGLDVDMWFDGSEFRVNSTISGVNPTQSYHLTTKYYVDQAITSISGGTFDHGSLNGLADDDHIQYSLADGTRAFSGTVSGVAPTANAHLTTKLYVDGEISTVASSIITDHGGLSGLGDDDHTLYSLATGSRAFTGEVGGIDPTLSGSLTTKRYVDTAITNNVITDHGGLSGLGDDDHSQYSLVDGSRAFTSTVGGITPTAGTDLTTKDYVDGLINGLDWQDSVIGIVPVASGITVSGSRYIASATGGGWTIDNIYDYNGASWDEIVPNEGFATWVEDQDSLYVYNGTAWVQFGSTTTHNNLSGLQGGTSGEYYHLTSAEESGLTGGGDTSLHIHDGRYYTETEVDNFFTGLSSIYAPISHNHPTSDITNFDEDAQDAVGDIMYGAGGVSVDYNDSANTITISGASASEIDHGSLAGLGDDDHTIYSLASGNRAFTGEVAGIDPTASGSLATKRYVDAQNAGQTSIYEHGRQVIADDASTVAITFGTALANTNYTINCTMENTSDSPPSIFAFIISAKATTGFSCTLMGDTDSANYYMDWSVISD